MGRKKIEDRGEIKKTFALTIACKWIDNQDHDKLREVACKAIQKHVESEKQSKTN